MFPRVAECVSDLSTIGTSAKFGAHLLVGQHVRGRYCGRARRCRSSKFQRKPGGTRLAPRSRPVIATDGYQRACIACCGTVVGRSSSFQALASDSSTSGRGCCSPCRSEIEPFRHGWPCTCDVLQSGFGLRCESDSAVAVVDDMRRGRSAARLGEGQSSCGQELASVFRGHQVAAGIQLRRAVLLAFIPVAHDQKR